MSQLDSYALTGKVNNFRQGVGAFRNARDLAKEQRNILIGQANAVARAQSADTMSFDGSNSHHPSPGEPPQYHMTQLRSFALTESAQSFRQGVGAFRNLRDLATDQRDKLIDQANAVARTQSADTMSFDDSDSQDTVTSMRGRLIDLDTSADELALDHLSAISRTKRQKKEEKIGQPPRIAPIEVQSQQVLMGNAPGRQLLLNGQKIFIPDHSWIPASRNGRKALFNSDKNMYTFIESKEPSSMQQQPRSMQEYFLPSEGSVKILSRHTSLAIAGMLQRSLRSYSRFIVKTFPRKSEAKVP
jgi:hypothetical protein